MFQNLITFTSKSVIKLSLPVIKLRRSIRFFPTNFTWAFFCLSDLHTQNISSYFTHSTFFMNSNHLPSTPLNHISPDTCWNINGVAQNKKMWMCWHPQDWMELLGATADTYQRGLCCASETEAQLTPVMQFPYSAFESSSCDFLHGTLELKIKFFVCWSMFVTRLTEMKGNGKCIWCTQSRIFSSSAYKYPCLMNFFRQFTFKPGVGGINWILSCCCSQSHDNAVLQVKYGELWSEMVDKVSVT